MAGRAVKTESAHPDGLGPSRRGVRAERYCRCLCPADAASRPSHATISSPAGNGPGVPSSKAPPLSPTFAKQVAERLASKLGEEHTPTRYAVAKEADISRQTLANVLDGRTWADLPTIYRLEVALKHQLWRNDDYPQTTSGA